MALHYSDNSLAYSFKYTILLYCFNHILRAGGVKPASRPPKSGTQSLITTNQTDQDFGQHFFNSCSNLAKGSIKTCLLATRTILPEQIIPALMPNRNISRSRRLARLRCTAFPQVLALATTPIFKSGSGL